MFRALNLNILNKGNNLVFTQPTSFEIDQGEIWMLKGPNGIGKSSLYEALVGLRPINFGQIFLDDVLLNDLSAVERVHLGLRYVSQANALFEGFSVEQNLKMCAEFLLPAKERKSAVADAISIFGLTGFAHKNPYHLSGGQRRLTELSKIMIGRCRLILMDEPFAAIDENMVYNISNVFVSLKEQYNYSFFINDHNTKAVERISSYCLHVTSTMTKVKNLQEVQ